ncbi:MAG TPA: LptA/OstA family protein [Caulobacteraceae bacterium]|nr:LptA/OstA family protein [Caulobacteraceae bacterium]
MKRWTAAMLVAAACVAVGSAQAQIAPGGGPIDIGADDLDVNDVARTMTWSGKVEALQGQNRLRADRVVVYYGKSGGAAADGGASMGDIEKLEARGNVYFVSPTQVVRGDVAVYTQATDTLVVTGEVILKQGENVLKGSRLVVQVGAGRATMDKDSNSRVRGVFYPNSRKGG